MYSVLVKIFNCVTNSPKQVGTQLQVVVDLTNCSSSHFLNLLPVAWSSLFVSHTHTHTYTHTHTEVGDFVEEDDVLAEIETDKVMWQVTHSLPTALPSTRKLLVEDVED